MNQSKKEKHRIRSQRWRDNHPGYYLTTDRNRRLVKRYGITLEQKEAMIESQNGLCAICHNPFTKTNKPCVDHCHETKVIRGILCIGCNRALGRLGDSIEKIENVLNYLKRSTLTFPDKPIIPIKTLVFDDRELAA